MQNLTNKIFFYAIYTNMLVKWLDDLRDKFVRR